jgi:hypothetical protein
VSETAGAGYSGTPPAKKLGVKPGHRVLVLHRPTGWRIPDLPAGAQLHDDALDVPDVVIAFYRALDRLTAESAQLVANLPPASPLWVAWPRRAGGHTSDITENALRDLLLPTGVVDVKVAAIDHDWSGLKFTWRTSLRPRAGG